VLRRWHIWRIFLNDFDPAHLTFSAFWLAIGTEGMTAAMILWRLLWLEPFGSLLDVA